MDSVVKKESKHITLIRLMLRRPSKDSGDYKRFWSRESRLANFLLKKYPELDFWKSLFYRDLNSFACIMTEKAKQYLENEYKKYRSFLPNEVKNELKNEKIDKDIIINFKPKSILDFIGDK